MGGGRGKEGTLLGGWVVSRTQYASFVSAMRWPSHFICRWRGVRSRRGGRGKLRGLRGGLVGSLGEGGILGVRRWRRAEMQRVMMAESFRTVEVEEGWFFLWRVLVGVWGVLYAFGCSAALYRFGVWVVIA